MRTLSLIPLVIPIVLPTSALAQASTDRTVEVARDTRLDLAATHGSITVRTWDRSAVRIQAQHAPHQVIEIERAGGLLKVEVDQQAVREPRSREDRAREARRAHHGKKDPVTFNVTVPRWMDLNVAATYAPIEIHGAGGRVQATNVQGSIDVRGGNEIVELVSVQGGVLLAGGRGRISVNSVNGGVTIADCTGPIVVETVNGGVRLTRVDSRNVAAETVNGGIEFDGTVYEDGVYRITTHHGPVTFALPEGTGADVTVETFHGSFSSSFPVDARSGRGPKTFSFVVGAGGADVELESFNGPVRLVRAGRR